MIEIPVDLPADLVPLSWLLGVWEGTGVIDYEVDDHHFKGEFSHRVSFSHDGGDFLNYSATATFVADSAVENDAVEDDAVEDDAEGVAQPLLSEVGYWRLARPATSADAGPALLPGKDAPVVRTADDVESLRVEEGGFSIEVSLARADGVCELYLGHVRGPRIDIATDAVVRSASAKAYTASTRMFGLVDGHLLWAWDIAALGAELSSHASARLAKVD